MFREEDRTRTKEVQEQRRRDEEGEIENEPWRENKKHRLVKKKI